MKLFFAVLLLFSAAGLIISILVPFFYKNSSSKIFRRSQEKISAYRPVFISFFAAMILCAAFGWQNTKDYQAAYSNQGVVSGSFIHNQYPLYSSGYGVTKVTAGDSAEVRLNNGPAPVKLIGIDLFRSVGDKERDSCYKSQAGKKLSELLKGKKVELEGDDSLADTNESNFLLRYVTMDGKNIDKEMIALGFAKAKGSGPDYKYRDEFLAAQKEAQKKELGLWSESLCPSNAVVIQGQGSGYPREKRGTGDIRSNPKKPSNNHNGGSRDGNDGSTDNSGGGESDGDNCIKLPILGCVKL